MENTLPLEIDYKVGDILLVISCEILQMSVEFYRATASNERPFRGVSVMNLERLSATRGRIRDLDIKEEGRYKFKSDLGIPKPVRYEYRLEQPLRVTGEPVLRASKNEYSDWRIEQRRRYTGGMDTREQDMIYIHSRVEPHDVILITH